MSSSALRLWILAAAISLLSAGCFEQNLVYLSPHTQLQNSYSVTPLLRDSLKTASYGSFGLAAGGANDQLSDNVFMAQGKFHQTLLIGNNLQSFLGIQGAAGSYRVNWENAYLPNVTDPRNLPVRPGTKFSGAVGLVGGIGLVLPVGRRLEWKVIGIEGSVSREFGEYQRFREKIPDSVVSMVDRRSWPATAGLITDFNFKLRNNKSLGMNFGGGWTFTKLEDKYNYYYGNRQGGYFTGGFHFTVDRYTGHFQSRFGNYFAGFQCGIAYRL